MYAHAQAVISSLRDELESERRAHAHTRERADAELFSLNARLARREAELEACVVHINHPLPGPPSSVSPHKTGTHSTTAKASSSSSSVPFTQDDAIKILELSAARNRTLETEIRNLLGQVCISFHQCSQSFTTTVIFRLAFNHYKFFSPEIWLLNMY